MKSGFTMIALVCLGLMYWCEAPRLLAVEAPLYEIDDLGTVGGNFTMPSDINEAGDVVGFVQTSTFDYHAFLYTDESGLRDLGTFGGDHWSQAFSINNRRHLVGTFTNTDGSFGSVLYGDDIGTIQVTGLAGAIRSGASELNDAEQVAGWSAVPGGSRAFVWSPTAGAQDIGTLGGSVTNPQAINVHGQVAGQSIVVDDPYFPVYHAFRYTPAVGMLDLGTLPGSNATYSSASGMNADGDVVGYSNDPRSGGAVRGFLYTDRGGIVDIGSLGGRYVYPSDINDNGAIVGAVALPTGQQHAFVYTRASGMVDLNSLIDSTSGWVLGTADAINNRGTIVGVASMGGRSHGYRARRIRDDSAPEIEALVSPTPNGDGWSSSPVTVRWSVRDPESGIASSSGCETQTLTDSTPGITFTCTAANSFGGSSSRSVTMKIDASAPEIAVSVSPQPNAAGWNNSDPTVTWSVRDPDTGIATSTGCGTQTLTNETVGIALTCTATNGAGGSTSRTVIVKIDKTAPVVTCAATPSVVWPPDGQMVRVSITVTTSDALSGAGLFTLGGYSVNDPTAGRDAITGFTVGTASTTGFVQALRQGNGDARVYNFMYQSTDAAGSTGSCTVAVVVPHDMGS